MKKFKQNWPHLLIGLILIALSVVTFIFPGEVFKSLPLFFGIVMIVLGVYYIYVFWQNKKKFNRFFISDILISLLSILSGLLMIFNKEITAVFICFLFSIVFITQAINNLMRVNLLRIVSPFYYWFSLIGNILAVGIGFMLMIDVSLSSSILIWVIAIYLLSSGIMHIIEYFNPNNDNLII